MKMIKFLQFVKQELVNLKTFERVHVVMGNESCDLDSAVCALTFGFYLNQTKSSNKTLHVPVLNIPKQDYRLRTEVTYHLNKYGLISDLLIFRDQIDLINIHLEQRLDLTLVDHNVLRGCDSQLEGAVCCVLDHHKLERNPSNSVEMTVETVGSCATLVADRILKSTCIDMDQALASFLLGPILVDTVCLAPEAGRTTAKDLAVVTRLESIVGGEKREAQFNDLQRAKADVSDLTTHEILRKDMKTIETTKQKLKITISSIPIPLTEYLKQKEIVQCLRTFCSQEEVKILVMMSLVNDAAGIQRQIAVFSLVDEYLKQVCQCLELCQSPSLGLLPLTSVDHILSSPLLCVYNQTTVTASRKQILPYLLHNM